MSVYKGKDGSVYIGAVKIAEITDWTLNLKGQREQILAFGDSSMRREYTISDSSCSFSGNYDQSNTTGQGALTNMFLSGGTLSAPFLYLYTSGGSGFYGEACVDVDLGATAAGLESFSATGDQASQWYTNIA